MIEIRNETKRYLACQSCLNGKHESAELRSICISADGNHFSSFRLCEECIRDLKEKL